MAFKKLPDAHVIRQLLRYDAATGCLVWLPRPRDMFANARQFARWNDYYSGAEAGRTSDKGYRVVKLNGSGYLAHRLIWKMVTGTDPVEIDHINRRKSDNRWENLRNVSHSINMRNKPRSRLNTSGHKHIHWMPKLGSWTVQLIVPGKGQRQLGYCKTIPEAVAVRNRIMAQYGYDPITDAG